MNQSAFPGFSGLLFWTAVGLPSSFLVFIGESWVRWGSGQLVFILEEVERF